MTESTKKVEFGLFHLRLYLGDMRKSVFTREYRVLLNLLIAARKSADLTQAQLGKRLRKSQSWVSKYERAERRIDVIELRQMCRVLGVTLPEFIERLEEAI